MGLLKDFGALLTYDQAKELQQKLKNMAALQLLYLVEKYQNWEKQPGPCCQFLWGDEIEGHRFVFDASKQRFQLYRGELPKLDFDIMPEYGRWMFEMIPDKPHNTKCNLLEIVVSLKNRYDAIHQLEQVYLTIPSVPFLGTTYTKELKEQGKFDNTITQSQFIDDSHITDHPRFRALTKNIRQRRGSTVNIQVPIFPDKKTNLQVKTEDEPYPGFIYMDAMAFGMGMSCLQCTFSTKNIFQARRIHDQLHVLSPLFLALSAGAPVFKGKLSDFDVRWFPLGDSVDDRTPAQRDPNSPNYQPKSRYASLSYFISDSNQNLPMYSDIKYQVNQEVVSLLKEKAYQKKIWMDQKLITHMGILASRDFMVVHQNFIKSEQSQYTLFEMLNSTNWNSVRFKIPIDDTIGWRVEFRTLEVQVTAEENSLFSILIFSLVRMINRCPNSNFYIPMSLIEKNFERAHKNNAILLEKFYFRINIYDDGEPIVKELTLYEIFFGSQKENFMGLVGMFKRAIEQGKLCQYTKDQIPYFVQVFEKMFSFLKKRLTGETITLAQWMRKFIRNHKSYNFDSTVTDQISRDLIFQLDGISKGSKKDPNFEPIF